MELTARLVELNAAYARALDNEEFERWPALFRQNRSRLHCSCLSTIRQLMPACNCRIKVSPAGSSAASCRRPASSVAATLGVPAGKAYW